MEILKALYRGAKLLILDEPTAALTDQEVEGLFAIIRRQQQFIEEILRVLEDESQMKSILLLLMGCILLFVLTILQAKSLLPINIKSVQKQGFKESEYITIGKIKQYIQIRGQDSSNPVILMLHGGPGNPMAYIPMIGRQSWNRIIP